MFWKLIKESQVCVNDGFDFLGNLKALLVRFNPKEIRNFDKYLKIKVDELNTYDHWALAYIVRNGCGDDAFDYFKSWCVSKGSDIFDSIKKLDNTKLYEIFKSEDPQLEELYYLCEDIYEYKTSDLMKPVKIKKSKIGGTEWNEFNVHEIYPEISILFKS